ncbi:MAG: NAD-reducing hydrogenase HoxS subunit alpha [Alphaproteobacteria bacterium MarineAlpha3_Bin1]|nr:MAG: NAD-reducing hydrogenase HoxS subunit alpha [Alphaproteobacteria bacterium MarineAlpha3_Bin1]
MGGGQSPFFPKGRQVEPEALKEVGALLGESPRRRDLLIEHLHLIQDHYGHLSARHLAALAAEMGLAQTEVYEVATFYAHFDVVREDETPPPPLTVRVCDSLTCEMMGAKDLLAGLQEKLGDKIRILPAPCMGRCETAPVAEAGHYHINAADMDKVTAAVENGQTHPDNPAYTNFDAYVADGGYALLKDCHEAKRQPDELIEILGASGLRGLGGAGFPTGQKWKIVRGYKGPRLMAVNADEGEPGTFKDRVYLETDPHRFLEGMLIAAWAVEAEEIYIYLRDEYPGLRDVLLVEIAKVEAAGLAEGTAIHLRRGAGAYICGEESAMIESIEGKRGLPRHRPPYVAEVGLFGRPTLVQNVETVYWIRDLVDRGPDWFSSEGRNGRQGRDPEELFEYGRTGVQADTDVDQHRRHDEHEGERGPRGRAVTALHELGERRDAAPEVDGHENEGEQQDREGCHPLEVPHGHANSEPALREADQVNRRDVRGEKSGSYDGPLQVAVCEEIGLSGLLLDLADRP